MSTLQEIILETVKCGIPVSLGYNENTQQVYYEVSGFAKSGNARLEMIDDEIRVLTRYDSKKTIENFQDLAYIAKYWYDAYKDRGYFIDDYWLKVFVEFGWMKCKETVVSYE